MYFLLVIVIDYEHRLILFVVTIPALACGRMCIGCGVLRSRQSETAGEIEPDLLAETLDRGELTGSRDYIKS